MAIFLQLSERSCNKPQIRHNLRVFTGKRKVLRIQKPIGCRLHYAVIIGSPKRGSKFNVAPIGSRLSNQQMKDGVVGG